jgi:hypothetical protein
MKKKFWVTLSFLALCQSSHGSSLDHSIRIRGSKPFGSAVRIQVTEAATHDSFFCTDASGYPKRRTKTLPYASDISNNYYFFLENELLDYCQYRVTHFSLEIAHFPPVTTYRTLPITIQDEAPLDDTSQHLSALEKVDCLSPTLEGVKCREKIGGSVKLSHQTPWWISKQDFEEGAEFVIHLRTVD